MSPTLYISLPVKDIDASVKWYTEALGFTLNKASYAPGFFASIILGGTFDDSRSRVMLRKWPEPGRHDGESRPEKCDMCFDISEDGKGKEVVDEKFRSIQETGVHAEVKEVPTEKPWMCRQFELEDPDGHHVTFMAWLKSDVLKQD